MKLFTENGLILAAALVFTGAASANKSDTIRLPAQLNTGTSYTAHGTMDKKTAMMVKYLLRNPHLQVKAEVHRHHPVAKPKTDVTVNYTIKGTTDRQTVLKLKRLLQNSKHIKIIARANINAKPHMAQNQRPARVYPAPNMTRYVPAYTPFYYNGVPPVYIQGNTVYYPVPVQSQAFKGQDKKQNRQPGLTVAGM